MKKTWMVFSACSALMAVAQVAVPPTALAAGEKANAVEPKEWLNNRGPISWQALKGRLVLVEKWATW